MPAVSSNVSIGSRTDAVPPYFTQARARSAASASPSITSVTKPRYKSFRRSGMGGRSVIRLEQRVDERRSCRARQEHENAERHEHDDDRQQPPLLARLQEVQELRYHAAALLLTSGGLEILHRSNPFNWMSMSGPASRPRRWFSVPCSHRSSTQTAHSA